MSKKLSRHLQPSAILFVGVMTLLTAWPAIATEGKKAEWVATSERNTFAITFAPLEGQVEVGKLQMWVLKVTLPDGTPVYPARIQVGGGMQSHGHGLPTQPLVTSYGGNGDYLVEGIRFSMEGKWRMSFHIQSAHGTDLAHINVAVSY